MNITENQDAIDDFIECVCEISDNINSDFWNGEDVPSIAITPLRRLPIINEDCEKNINCLYSWYSKNY